MLYIEKLYEKLGTEKVTQQETELKRHSKDESMHDAVYPDVVCFPESKEDIQIILHIASEYQIAVTPFGAGSGLEGQVIPIQKGISLDFQNMNKVLDFSPEDMRVTVQPGIMKSELNQFISQQGLFFAGGPDYDATIGGMTATNASGTRAVRYGVMRDQILDLEVVLADGMSFHTGTKAKKSSSGYHLTSLFAGSEGTLGIITEITLKLHSIPDYSTVARCTFETPELCAIAAQNILLNGIPIMRMELIDSVSIGIINKQCGHDFPVKHSLFLEFAGPKNTVAEEVKLASKIMHDLGCENWDAASDSISKKKLWEARVQLAVSFQDLKGMKEIGGDVCVPISQLPKLVSFTRSSMDESGLKGALWGHIGDGNFHTSILYNPEVNGEQELAEQINDAIVNLAIEVGGTCTGEHGVGLGKKKFQVSEHGAALEMMQRTKQLYDPKGILNPGKIFS
ncbi:FAD-binding oxidoreductase [Oceanobacillus jeddahense]|uniref:D-lactate dehydrogenase (cytochrome) n=1 Tax=Oceanobacillus jeddahense TaxID=1462527 RepID=A0ABY5JP20_9BACI|nr:FAD-linked oxidase C-terminal domain-containing protein [Oceanobacillus jeddahense]UUI02053.1 FAD-binding protein [Oceanobacillus jeddahense]